MNELNGKHGISAPENSVPVIKLIREHCIMVCSTLSYEIKRHSEERCYCGIISRGTVDSFGDNLYQAQFDEWGEESYSLAEWRRWIFVLFVVNSLKGNKLERHVAAFNKRDLPHLKIVKT